MSPKTKELPPAGPDWMECVSYAYLWERVWWECPECYSIFPTEDEADRCAQMDLWPEDCVEWMRSGLVPLPQEFET